MITIWTMCRGCITIKTKQFKVSLEVQESHHTLLHRSTSNWVSKFQHFTSQLSAFKIGIGQWVSVFQLLLLFFKDGFCNFRCLNSFYGSVCLFCPICPLLQFYIFLLSFFSCFIGFLPNISTKKSFTTK